MQNFIDIGHRIPCLNLGTHNRRHPRLKNYSPRRNYLIPSWTKTERNLPTMKSLKTISEGEATKISTASGPESTEAEEEPMGARSPGVGGKTLEYDCPPLRSVGSSAGISFGTALTRVLTTESSVTGRKRGFFR